MATTDRECGSAHRQDAPPRPATRRSTFIAVAALSLCCLLWGLSFPTMQRATKIFAHVGRPLEQPDPMWDLTTAATFNGWRFLLAAVVYWLLTLRMQRRHSRGDLLGGTAIGLFFAPGMLLQVMGLRYTLPSVSGFLTAISVVFAPLGQAWIFRRRVGRETILAVILAVIGMAVLSAPNPHAIAANTAAARPPLPLLGEVLTVAAAVFFTGQILLVDRFGRSGNPARLAFLMLAVSGLINALVGLALGGRSFYTAAVFSAFFHDFTLGWGMAALVLLSSVLAFHLMNTYQPRISPAMASVIYCLEPIFAAMFSALFAAEKLTPITLGGGAIILCAVLIVIHAAAKNRSSERVAARGCQPDERE